MRSPIPARADGQEGKEDQEGGDGARDQGPLAALNRKFSLSQLPGSLQRHGVANRDEEGGDHDCRTK